MSRKFVVIAALLTVFFAAPAERPSAGESKLDRELQARARVPRGSSRVILRLTPGVSPASAEGAIRSFRGTIGRRLASVGGQVAYVPDGSLDALGRVPGVSSVSLDRRVQGTLERTGGTIGANWVRENLGFDGTGVGIAVIDSGVANWHDDLGSSRVTRFVDFVNFQTAAYDDYGHGTHVAGVIAGNGHDSGGRRRAVEAGLVVVSAAGNLGKGPGGKPQYGAIGAPGNAPWVITVGASSHNGTIDRSDDTDAGFSS